MKTTINRFCLAVLLLAPLTLQARPKSLETQALETMKTATQYMMDVVSYRGGFVWNYLPDLSRQWWVQAETVVGNLWLWKYHEGLSSSSSVISDSSSVISSEVEKSQFLLNAIAAWNYIKNNLVDSEGGEWWWAILPDGSIDKANPKAGFWKCPYHNTRMCLQVMTLI